MGRYQRWLATLADDRENGTTPGMWLSTLGLVLVVLLLAGYVEPVTSWFQLRFWAALACFLPSFLFGFIASLIQPKGGFSLPTHGLLILVGITLLQFFFAALMALSRPPGSFALASLYLLTLAFHGFWLRATPTYPYVFATSTVATAGAVLVNPDAQTLALFAFVTPTALLVCLLAGKVGLRQHLDSLERDKLKQAVYYRSLTERSTAHSQVSQQVLHLLRYNHDAANTLSTVFVNAQLLDERVSRLDPAATEAVGAHVLISRLLEQLGRLKSLLFRAHEIADEMPTVEPARLSQVVEDTAKDCRALFPEVAIEIANAGSVDIRVRVHEGELGLRRILENVLQNACEGDGARRARNIRVRIEPESSRVRISCCDDGPGFSRALLEESPAPFQTTKANGHGLGLFSVSHLVQASGGRLSLENAGGGGAVVNVELSLEVPA